MLVLEVLLEGDMFDLRVCILDTVGSIDSAIEKGIFLVGMGLILGTVEMQKST